MASWVKEQPAASRAVAVDVATWGQKKFQIVNGFDLVHACTPASHSHRLTRSSRRTLLHALTSPSWLDQAPLLSPTLSLVLLYARMLGAQVPPAAQLSIPTPACDQTRLIAALNHMSVQQHVPGVGDWYLDTGTTSHMSSTSGNLSSINSTSGFNYYLVLLDDYSHFAWTFPLRRKSDALAMVEHFHHFVHTQFNLPIDPHYTSIQRL